MVLKLKYEDCYCSLRKFYENVAEKMSIVVTRSMSFDTYKISINKHVLSALREYLRKEKGYSDLEVTCEMAAYGPKGIFPGFEYFPVKFCCVRVEDGFVSGDIADVQRLQQMMKGGQDGRII